MTITFLGTGTSQGIPVIACECITCQSTNPKDKRLRCSIYIEVGDAKIVIDVGPDFRHQMLNAGVKKIDAVQGKTIYISTEEIPLSRKYKADFEQHYLAE